MSGDADALTRALDHYGTPKGYKTMDNDQVREAIWGSMARAIVDDPGKMLSALAEAGVLREGSGTQCEACGEGVCENIDGLCDEAPWVEVSQYVSEWTPRS